MTMLPAIPATIPAMLNFLAHVTDPNQISCSPGYMALRESDYGAWQCVQQTPYDQAILFMLYSVPVLIGSAIVFIFIHAIVEARKATAPEDPIYAYMKQHPEGFGARADGFGPRRDYHPPASRAVPAPKTTPAPLPAARTPVAVTPTPQKPLFPRAAWERFDDQRNEEERNGETDK